jgi:3-oxoacyl-[acyl-carrier-protein] synthase-3
MGEAIRAVITGVGHCVPSRVLTNFDLEKMVETSDTWIRERTGIVERRITDAQTATSDLACEAARRALAEARLDSADLDFILVATATPDFAFPATACIVQGKIGAKRAAACDLEVGCAGFVYALSMAAQMIVSGAWRRMLVIGADTLSKITNWSDRNTCVLFGDGAGAVVLEASTEGDGVMAVNLRSDGSGEDLLKLEGGGSRNPTSGETLARQMHYLRMAGSEVFKFAVKVITECTQQVLASAGLEIADVDLFVPHQANLRIMNAAAHRLGIADDRVFRNVQKYGNTSCASIPIALSEAVEEGRIRKGDVVVICGFGAGLGWGGSVMRWGYTRAVPPTGATDRSLQPADASVPAQA